MFCFTNVIFVVLTTNEARCFAEEKELSFIEKIMYFQDPDANVNQLFKRDDVTVRNFQCITGEMLTKIVLILCYLNVLFFIHGGVSKRFLKFKVSGKNNKRNPLEF